MYIVLQNRTMKYWVVIIFFVTLQSPAISQLNYDDIRSNLVSYCRKVDDSIIMQNVNFVDSVSKLKIESGLDHFLEDYARAYYAKYMITKDRNDLIISINAHARHWEQFNSTSALYGLASSYAAYDCFMSLKYIKILESKIEKNELDFPENKEVYVSQIAIIREALCPE